MNTNSEINALLYNTTNMNSLSRNSSILLKKYKNNRVKTVMIMNRYKKRKKLLDKGLDLVKIYKYSPNSINTLINTGNITTKRGQSISNYLRGKATMKNEPTGDLFATKMIVAKKPFTFLGQKVNGFIPFDSSSNLKETHAYAKFIGRRLRFKYLNDIKPKFTIFSEKHGGGLFF